MTGIGLGEAIRALREELTEAKGQGEGAWMRFGVGPVELEVQAVVTKEANGKIGWKIVELGGSAGKETTQTVKLTLTPVWWDPAKSQYTPDWLVSGTLPDKVGGPDDGHVETPLAGSAGSATGAGEGTPRTDTDPEDED